MEPVPQALEGVRAACPGVDTNGLAVLLRGTLPEDTSPHTYKHSDTSTQVPGLHTFMGPLRAHASTKTQMLLVGRTSSSQTPCPGSQPRAPGLICHSVQMTVHPLPQLQLAQAEAGMVKHSHSSARAHSPAPCFPKRTCRHKTMGRQAYLLVMELFLSLRVSSRCCSSTMNLDRSSGVLGGSRTHVSAGCALKRDWLTREGGPKPRQPLAVHRPGAN